MQSQYHPHHFSQLVFEENPPGLVSPFHYVWAHVAEFVPASLSGLHCVRLPSQEFFMIPFFFACYGHGTAYAMQTFTWANRQVQVPLIPWKSFDFPLSGICNAMPA